MKKIITIIIIAIVCSVALFAFKQQEKDKSLAKVNRVDGYYIFIQCQPVNQYDVLGTVKKTGLVWTGKPTEMYNTLIRKAKKDYPKSDGIIFEDVAMEHATCIQFKE